MSSPTGLRREGFALLLVVVLLGLACALALSALDSNIAEANAVHLDHMRRRTTMAAESEVWNTILSQNADDIRRAPLGTASVTRRMEGDITLISTIDKVDTTNVWIVATAAILTSSSVMARHRVGLSARIPRDSADSVLHVLPERAWVELF